MKRIALCLTAGFAAAMLAACGGLIPGPAAPEADNGPRPTDWPTLPPSPRAATATATATLTPTPTPIPQSALMAEELAGIDVPAFDPIDWVNRTGALDEPITDAVVGGRIYSVGQRATFNVFGIYEATAQLVYANDVVAMWVEDGVRIDRNELAEAADRFAYETVPQVREVFGDEWSPGIDGDPRLHILHLFWLGPNIAGAFVPMDEYPAALYPISNQREMFYVSWLALGFDPEEYSAALAHEFQHMVQFHTDPNEATWMNEGLSQIAERVTGHDTAFTHLNYLFNSRIQLSSWSQDFRESYSNYGAAYLYLLYIRERFGDDAIAEIAHSPLASLQSVDAALEGRGSSADAVFADWIVANYLNDPELEDGRYGYTTETLIPICPRTRFGDAHAQRPGYTMPQYSASYFELRGEGQFTVDFEGEREARLFPANPHSGDWVWWSNMGDDSEATLTRPLDLTGLTAATLQFWTWYDIEEGRDVGDVMASTDGGETWSLLESSSMVTADDLEIYGPHLTGGSGGGRQNPVWTMEEIDLTPYTGQEVMIRFAYITDLQYNGAGWAIDDIRIPELDYVYNAEEGDDGWEAVGFVRTTNAVPQNWVVYVVTYDGATTVQRLELDGENAAHAEVTLTPENDRATIIIGAMAPDTKVPAEYSLRIGGDGQIRSLDTPPGILYQEDFGSACTGFASFVLPDYQYSYQEGIYEIAIQIADTFIPASAGQEFSDIVIEVDTFQTEATADSTTGLICRYQDANNFYDLSIRNDGTYSIAVWVDGYAEYLVDWTESDAIQTGRGASNHLMAVCNGNELSLSANGVFLGSAHDSHFRRGDIGFSAGTFDVEEGSEGIRVQFDNLVVRRPE